jgi:UDP:flavonoid glycosyltransferase YjiC (YdhE family)
MRQRDRGRALNRAAWWSFAAGSGLLMHDRQMNAYRRSLGVPTKRGNALLGWTSAARTVVLTSRHYFGDEPDDWDGIPLVGFSHWSGPADRHADPDVHAFVDAGDAPVLVCLGTSAATGAGAAFARIGRDLDGRRLRSLLLVGDAANLEPVRDRDGAFAFAPVHEVIDRCRVAVVSGALGTLAAALAAGVPVVVLPQLFDQVWHGLRVEQLGVGIRVRGASQVADAVARIEADPAYRARTRALADAMRDEDGAVALADAVESVL